MTNLIASTNNNTITETTPVKVAHLKIIADRVTAGHVEMAQEMLRHTLMTAGPAWKAYGARINTLMQEHISGDLSGVVPFSIFAKDGNRKLPFPSFSALAGGSGCEGAGDCESWCYSFKGWRYPAAYFRQLQNSILLSSDQGRDLINTALDAFEPKDGSSIDFRLYVDGDFRDVQDLDFWMVSLADRPWLKAYGYSKSWKSLLAYDQDTAAVWPTNYRLNLSSGSRFDDAMQAQVEALTITRGRFVAVEMPYRVNHAMHNDRVHQQALRDTYKALTGRTSFTCAGDCGDCTPSGHACGSTKFNNVDIIIACH